MKDKVLNSGSMIDALNHFVDIEFETSDDDYQGTSYALVSVSEKWRDENKKYGYVTSGFGSCEGCDAWMYASSFYGIDGAAEALGETADMVVGLLKSIKWFESEKALLDDLQGRDTELQWYAYENGFKDFVKELKSRVGRVDTEPDEV